MELIGRQTTASGNHFWVMRPWRSGGRWKWGAGGTNGFADSYEEAVIQATFWADHAKGRL